MNKYAIVTGASSGIGREFARLLAADSYDLLIAARDKDDLESVARGLREINKIKVDVVSIDLSDVGAADKLWAQAEDRQVDVLINNAGFGDLSPLEKASWERLEAMINLNITALTRLTQLAIVSMKQNGSGRILNVASIASFFPGPGMATYYATKSYVLNFTEAVAQELGGSGVTVTALCPGPTKSGFQKAAAMEDTSIMQGKLPSSVEVATYGYDAMNSGKVVAVHGFRNALTASILPRILSRSAVRKLVDRIQNS